VRPVEDVLIMRSTAMRLLPAYTCAVQLKDGIDKRPALFICPGLGGTTDALVELCASIVLPLRIYAFQSRGIDGTLPPDTRVEEMADHYLAELTRLQPNGPYLLCGHSFGGLVAFEMAGRLHAVGAEIAALILLDTPIHQSFWPRSYFLSVLLQRLRHHFAVIPALPLKKIAGYTARTALMLANTVLTYRRLAKPMIISDEELAPALEEVWNCTVVAWANYSPGFYPGKVVYFSAAIPGPMTFDPDVLWGGRVQELEVRVVAGAHRSMLDQPHVSALASTLADYLPIRSPD
jgi:thioesterase domain-containing protein